MQSHINLMNDSHLNSEIQFVKFKITFNNLVPFFSRNQNQKPIIKESRIEIDKYLFLQVDGIFGIGIPNQEKIVAIILIL